MADATVTLGLDASGVSSGLKKATGEVNAFSSRVQSSPLGRVGRSQMGTQVSYQLQDIAVQAQMGTNALTIFSQQAPQLLSALGGGQLAALSGAVAAIGGALVYAGYKGSEAFKGLIQDASALDVEIGKLTSGGSLGEMEGAFDRIIAKQQELRKSQEAMAGGSFASFTRELSASLGFNEGGYDQNKQAAAALTSLEKTKLQLASKLVETSARNLEIAQLRANGENATADAMERQATLEARIAEIKESGMDDYTKGRLIQDAYVLSEIQEKQKTKTFDIAKNIQEQANAANSILAPYQQFLNFLDEAKRKQDAINQANKEARKNAQLQIESQKNAAQSLEDEIRMIDARATGDEKKIKAAERELAIKEKSRQIQQQLGLAADKATAIATAIQDAKDKAEGKDIGGGGDSGRKKIMGYSWERQGGSDAARARAAQRRAESDANRAAAYSRGFGGLNEFYRNQQDPMFARPVTPNLDRMKENPAGTTTAAANKDEQASGRGSMSGADIPNTLEQMLKELIKLNQ
jgi:hypothetical protein